MAVSEPGVIGPVINPVATFEVVSVNESSKTVTVRGRIFQADSDTPLLNRYFMEGGSFGLFYGQLIRDRVNGLSVKFFDPEITPDSTDIGGMANNTTFEGLCQVCHTATKYWTKDNKCRDVDGNEITCAGAPDQHNSQYNCKQCHEHENGFGGAGHPIHEARSGFSCNDFSCHGTSTPPLMANDETLATTTVCAGCHNNGKWTYDGVGNPIAPGPPNITDYKAHFEDSNYRFGCFGCHDGMPENSIDETVLNMGSSQCDPARSCKDCHSGKKTPDCTNPVCSSCHDGSGILTNLPASDDLQRDPVGMESAGHHRLVSTDAHRC